jgi:hypothetical protein
MRLGHDARRAVVFFGVKNSEGGITYGGTGFLVAVPFSRDYAVHYLVTCRHVAKHLDVDFVIRGNDRDGSAFALDVDQLQWVYHQDDTVDVAIAPLLLHEQAWDRVYLPIDVFLGDAEKPNVLCGDDIAIVGLFRLHFGKGRNIPIVHSGTIAALADANEKVPIEDRVSGKITLTEAHLVEAQTLEGLSGSPVFIQQYAGLPFEQPSFAGRQETVFAMGAVRLLGMYSGAWDGRPGTILEKDKNLSNANYRVPVGMGAVVPGEKIVEVIMGKFQSDVRQNKIKDAEPPPATTDDAFSTRAVPATDANPTHREDFMRLVGAAARKPAPKD